MSHPQPQFIPDFSGECRICGTSPTVVIPEHVEPETDLCGVCFWQDRVMLDPELWNDQPEPTE